MSSFTALWLACCYERVNVTPGLEKDENPSSVMRQHLPLLQIGCILIYINGHKIKENEMGGDM
jgi:hypothetical protein